MYAYFYLTDVDKLLYNLMNWEGISFHKLAVEWTIFYNIKFAESDFSLPL